MAKVKSKAQKVKAEVVKPARQLARVRREMQAWWDKRPESVRNSEAPRRLTTEGWEAVRTGPDVQTVGEGKLAVNVDLPFFVPGEESFLIRRDVIDLLIDPRRQIDKECGYPEEVTPFMYHALFQRDGTARRVVELMPKECWVVDPVLYETEDEEIETDFEVAWQELSKRVKAWYNLFRADVLSGIGRYGVMLLGVGDGKDLSEPLDGLNDRGERVDNAGNVQGKDEGFDPDDCPKHSLLYLRSFDESVLRVNMRESNMQNPRYGQPTMYTLTFKDLDITDLAGAGIATVGDVTRRVHWTRVIHYADNREMSEVYGVPRMKPVFNRIVDIRKVLGGSAEMFWKGGFPGIAFELQPGVGDQELDMDSIRQQIGDYENGLQRYLALAGVSVKTLPPQIAEPSKHLDVQFDNIALALGCPKRVFLGSEQAQLASSQDKKTWNGRVAHRREKYVSDLVVRPFVDRCIALGILPEPDEYFVWWDDLNAMTDDEKATVALKQTQAISAYISSGADQLIPPEQFLTMIQRMEPEHVGAVLKAMKEYAGSLREGANDYHIEGADAPLPPGQDVPVVEEAAVDPMEAP